MPADTQYILLPRAVDAEPASSKRRDERKRIKAMLREALGARWDGELVGAMTALRPVRIPAKSGPDAAASHAAIRARGLHRLGVAIIENATEADLATIEESGFIAVPNATVTVPRPVAHGEAAPPTNDSFWHLRAVGAHDSGWNQPREAGLGTVVGILDTGIGHHREFESKSVEFRCFREDGQPCRDQSRRDHDRHGSHGTHVSAIAAGSFCGVAPRADLCVAAVLTAEGPDGMSGSRTQILNGLNWLIDRAVATGRPMVINASLGGSGYDTYLREAVRRALVANVLFVAAVGNDGDKDDRPTHGSPGNYGDALAVGATDQSDHLCDFSGWGVIAEENGLAKPDICAPGHLIRSAVAAHADQRRYGYLSGTSMAAPIVTGIACRLLGTDAALRTDTDALRKRLLSSTRKAIGPAERTGAGIVTLPRPGN